MKLFALLITILLSVSCNGSRTEEFVTYVRSADELFRQGKDEEAMNALVKAEKCYDDDIPSSALGSLKMRKGDIYYRYFDYAEAIGSYEEGAEIFLASGDTLNYCNALLLLCDASILNLDASRAHIIKGMLESNGIPVEIFGDGLSETLGVGKHSMLIRILVRKRDKAAAEELINE